jgi:TetR/AcrR family transcriptional regulator, cholesterol catabolism regulator
MRSTGATPKQEVNPEGAADGRTRGSGCTPTFEERRLAIIRGSIDVFWTEGYAGATLRLIASAAGMEKGHLTYYFKTKDDLLFEVVDDLQDRFAGRLTDCIGQGGDPLNLLYAVLRAHVELACVLHRQTNVAYDNMRFLSSARRTAATEKRAKYESHVLDLVKECQATATGVADIPATILSKVLLGIVSWIPYWYDPDGFLEPQDIATMMARQAIAALFPVAALAQLPQ